jgi:hypothetical protein
LSEVSCFTTESSISEVIISDFIVPEIWLIISLSYILISPFNSPCTDCRFGSLLSSLSWSTPIEVLSILMIQSSMSFSQSLILRHSMASGFSVIYNLKSKFTFHTNRFVNLNYKSLSNLLLGQSPNQAHHVCSYSSYWFLGIHSGSSHQWCLGMDYVQGKLEYKHWL